MSPPFVVRKIVPGPGFSAADPKTLPEFHGIESVLTKAFAEDHFTAVVTGQAFNAALTDTTRITALWMSTVVAGLLAGEVWIAETNESDTDKTQIVGCAVWFGPGHTLYDTEEQQKYSLGPLMAHFDEQLQKWWGGVFLPKYTNFVNVALGPEENVKHNSWHLQTLGVDPAFRQQGAARLLVDSIAEKGVMMCAEVDTELHVEIFVRMGFDIMPKGKGGKDECCETYVGVDGESSFRMWVMARGAK
ncbi:hypothetical protein DFH06DRAFT_1206014 [Mycena polygramma]|nr:hypothetical protein DFH06DRAFT_1206014 [Mycena polygramma]